MYILLRIVSFCLYRSFCNMQIAANMLPESDYHQFIVYMHYILYYPDTL